MTEKKFKVIIRTPNSFFVVNRVVARSPLTFIVNEGDLNAIRTKIKYEGISDYSIEELKEGEKIVPDVKVVSAKTKLEEIIPEEKKEKATTILEELIGE